MTLRQQPGVPTTFPKRHASPPSLVPARTPAPGPTQGPQLASPHGVGHSAGWR